MSDKILNRLIKAGKASQVRYMFPGSGGQPYPVLNTLIDLYGTDGNAPEVLMLGDSVSERVASEDVDRRRLNDMAMDRIRAKRSCASISHTAYQPAIYSDLLEVVSRLPNAPRVVILPINLRAFSLQWHGNPLWRLEQEHHAIRSYLADPTRPILAIEGVEAGDGFFDEFDGSSVRLSLSSLTSNGDLRAISRAPTSNEAEITARYREIFAWHYSFEFETDHPKLNALRNALDTVRRMGATAVCYLTPLNVESGGNLHGARFRETIADIAHNIAKSIAPSLDAGGHMFADFSALLGRDFFFNNNLATEHLNARGRAKLARASTDILQNVG